MGLFTDRRFTVKRFNLKPGRALLNEAKLSPATFLQTWRNTNDVHLHSELTFQTCIVSLVLPKKLQKSLRILFVRSKMGGKRRGVKKRVLEAAVFEVRHPSNFRLDLLRWRRPGRARTGRRRTNELAETAAHGGSRIRAGGTWIRCWQLIQFCPDFRLPLLRQRAP